MATLPSTSPITSVTSARVVLGPHLVHDREVGLEHLRRSGAPTSRGRRSGETATTLLAVEALVAVVAGRRAAAPSCGRPGSLKKPWIWPAWRSIVSTRSTPAASSKSATRRAVIGSRGARLLVLARVREPRDDGGDPLRRGELRGLDHDQQLDQVVVHRRVAGLDDERRRRRGSTRRSERRSRRSRRSSARPRRARRRACRRSARRARGSSGRRRASAASAARARSRACGSVTGSTGSTVSSPGVWPQPFAPASSGRSLPWSPGAHARSRATPEGHRR